MHSGNSEPLYGLYYIDFLYTVFVSGETNLQVSGVRNQI